MNILFENDIVNSATPLETRFAGVHPRLYATDAQIAELRERVGREPWAGFLQRVEKVAQLAVERGVPGSADSGDPRGSGCGLAHLAVAYRLTGKVAYLESARSYLAAMAANENWTHSLIYGHWAHGVAVAYDWLYHELDEPLRDAVRGALHDRTEYVYARWCDYLDAYPTGYAWNHMGVVHCGIMSAGCAIWGEVEGAGKWLRMALEKLRLMAGALGSDGASAEGLAYGQYHVDFLFKSLTFAHDLLGEDFIHDVPFLQNYPQFMLHSMLPQSVWTPTSTFAQVGDNNGHHWYGPDTHLRFVARHYRDGHAQWLADETARAGIAADSSSFLNLFWHDETITPRSPGDLPTLHHCDDKDIVFLRSSWEREGAVAAFKCGPNSGHHARRYRHNIGGGHMHPDAGHFILHAHGDWLLIDDGYCVKQTSYQNTVLVNGIGQTGEGGDWFEDLEMRRGKPEGRILLAQHGAEFDVVIADAAPAYKPEARLRRFLRHLLYVRPDVWVLVDELEAEAESSFELRFHAPRPFEAISATEWSMVMDNGALRLHTPGPTPVSARTAEDAVMGISGNHPDRNLDMLSINNERPQQKAVFVTVLHAHPAHQQPELALRLQDDTGVLTLDLERASERIPVRIRTGHEDARTSVFELLRG